MLARTPYRNWVEIRRILRVDDKETWVVRLHLDGAEARESAPYSGIHSYRDALYFASVEARLHRLPMQLHP